MTQSTWRTPLVVLICGGIILTLSLGTRHTFGLFLQPMTLDLDWSRQTFAFAIAFQNLIFGFATPLFGMAADKWGTARVLVVGGVLYALGVALMSYSTTGSEFVLTAGVLVGMGLACTGFSPVFGPIARAFPPEKRTLAMGIAGSAGSFGQFLLVPYGQTLISHIGWHNALLICAATVMLILPLSSALVEDRKTLAQVGGRQSVPEALREALGHGGYLLLCSGYFVCGFQITFISVHFPAYMIDQRMTPETGMTALALIGLFNIFGTYLWGWLGQHYTKKYVLSVLYFTRAAVTVLFIALPVSPFTVYVFAATIGFLWLGTVPVTSGLIAQIFGVKYVSTLTGIAFLFHQVGSFIGVWIGGYLFDATGSYQLMWILTIALGVMAGLINLPIDDRPVARPAAAPA
jgi:MFS family permease